MIQAFNTDCNYNVFLDAVVYILGGGGGGGGIYKYIGGALNLYCRIIILKTSSRWRELTWMQCWHMLPHPVVSEHVQ